jgi:hypothetical protein
LEQLRKVLGLDSVKDAEGNVIQNAPLPVWANFRQRACIKNVKSRLKMRLCSHRIAATCLGAEGLNACMKAKSFLQIIAALMISAAMATTTIAAGKINPEAVSKGMLTALNNQAGLSADQQEKAKPIIDKHVADLEALKNDTTLDKAAKKAKVVELRQQYVTDINGILTPDQQKKWEASREANKTKIKAHMAKKAAEKAPQ